ncbi:retrovirus-related pol polyprotein from transposon TNT 1-94 [Tanacetum coccineum]
MDLCGPMRVASVNGKKYILVIVDDYSRFTWVKCLRSKDEAPYFIIKFLKMIQVRLKVPVRQIRTDNGTEFQNGVVERRYRTLIEAARTMLIYAKAPLFLCAEAVATACYTQNRSIIRLHNGKTPYELLHDKLPDLSFFHVFGALCYPTNDSENLGKRIIETIHVDFDELPVMASEHSSLESTLHEMNPVTISSGLVPNLPPSTLFVPPSRTDWDILFQPLFDELLTLLIKWLIRQALKVIDLIAEVVAPVPAASTSLPSLTNVDQDAPSPNNAQTTLETQSPIISNDVVEENHDLDVTHMNNDPFFGILIPKNDSEASSLWLLKPKNYKDALTKACWIEAMQEELNEFKRLEVWELVPSPDKVMISQSPRGIFLNQSKYALESLKKYGMESSDPVDTPMVEKSKLDEDTQGKAVDPTHYRGMAKPAKKHLHAVKRIFKYLRGTVNRGLWYPKDSSIALTAYADADHAGCQDTRRSTSGSMQLLGERLVSWSSKRQKSAVISSIEAEYIALSGCFTQVLWMRSQLTDYGLGFNKIPMYCDNKSAIALCCNNVSNILESKQIEIRSTIHKRANEN